MNWSQCKWGVILCSLSGVGSLFLILVMGTPFYNMLSYKPVSGSWLTAALVWLSIPLLICLLVVFVFGYLMFIGSFFHTDKVTITHKGLE